MCRSFFRLRPNLPFEGKVRIPRMTMDAKYASTGVLLVLPANGNGTFHADLGLYFIVLTGSTLNGADPARSFLFVHHKTRQYRCQYTAIVGRRIYRETLDRTVSISRRSIGTTRRRIRHISMGGHAYKTNKSYITCYIV